MHDPNVARVENLCSSLCYLGDLLVVDRLVEKHVVFVIYHADYYVVEDAHVCHVLRPGDLGAEDVGSDGDSKVVSCHSIILLTLHDFAEEFYVPLQGVKVQGRQLVQEKLEV